MNDWDYCRIAVECEALTDWKVRQVFDLDEVEYILKGTDKAYLSPLLDPKLNDFTPSNCFWLVAENEEGPVIAGGVRLDILDGTSVDRFWGQILRRAFGEAPTNPGSPFPDDVLAGRVAYFGDLISCGATSLSRAYRDNLRYFTFIGHFLTRQHFNADVTYCFVQDKDYLRGTPGVYGFLDHEPFMYKWKRNPYPQGSPEWVSFLSRGKFDQLASVMRRVTEARAHKILEAFPTPPRP